MSDYLQIIINLLNQRIELLGQNCSADKMHVVYEEFMNSDFFCIIHGNEGLVKSLSLRFYAPLTDQECSVLRNEFERIEISEPFVKNGSQFRYVELNLNC